MNKHFLVSILIPIYGVEKYIERCAVNLFEQTYDNLEFIFVDDCSPDRSIIILQSVIKRYPTLNDKIRIIRHEKNRGLAAARNTAVNAAKGEFVMHVDSDDWTDKTIVEKCVKKQFETNADIIFTDILTIYKHYSIVEKWKDASSPNELCLDQLRSKNRWNMWAQMIRTSLYKDFNIEAKEGCNMGEDYHTAPRLSYYAKQIAYVHESLYFHDHSNENSYSNNFKEAHYEQKLAGCNLLLDFFKNKGEEYKQAIYETLLLTYVGAIKEVCLKGGHNNFYNEQCKNIDTLKAQYSQSLSRLNKLVIKLMHHRILLTLLCKVFTKAKVFSFYLSNN